MGRAGVRGVGRGTGRVVFTEGLRPPRLGPPAPRPQAASGMGAPIPQSSGVGESGCARRGRASFLGLVWLPLCTALQREL